MINYQDLFKNKSSTSIVEDIIQQAYYDIPKTKVAQIIAEHHNVKVTDTLVEKYIELAASRTFTLDPVVLDIRKQNKLDHNLIENKLEFVLNDSSIITITEESFKLIQPILQENKQAIEYMSTSKEHFMKMFNVIAKSKES